MPGLPPFPSTPSSPSSPQGSSLRLPANKRIGTPVSQRLISITDPDSLSTRSVDATGSTAGSETGDAGGHSTTTSTHRRRSLASIRLPPPFQQRRTSGTSSKISHPAPPYDWVPEPIDEAHDGRVPVEGEKLRQLRREDDEGRTVLWWRRKRGVVLVVVIIVLIALAVGLGVGFSHQARATKDAVGAGNRIKTPFEFPLGQWMVEATLVEANTGCTSNSSIWRCYPYTVGGETTFDLTVNNTSELYAPNSTVYADNKPMDVPANLTVSSSNPFAIPYTNQSLSYITASSNETAERLEWTFEMTKTVMPSSSMMGNGGTAECAFLGTMFTGSLFLNAPRTVVEEASNRQWPYAFEIRQSVRGGEEAVECRGISGGSVSVPGAGGMCDCTYRNY